MPALHRYALSALLVALPFVAAQEPPAGAPEGATDKQGDEGMAKYPEWYSNDYNCGKYFPGSIDGTDLSSHKLYASVQRRRIQGEKVDLFSSSVKTNVLMIQRHPRSVMDHLCQ